MTYEVPFFFERGMVVKKNHSVVRMQAARVAAVRRSSAPTANANGASSGSPHASSNFPWVLWQPAWPPQATLVQSANRPCNLTFAAASSFTRRLPRQESLLNGLCERRLHLRTHHCLSAWRCCIKNKSIYRIADLLDFFIHKFQIYSYYLYYVIVYLNVELFFDACDG